VRALLSNASEWSYDFFRDQGGTIGGLLALVAGGLAYRAGQKQAAVAERQIQVRVSENSKERVRSAFIAHRQLVGLLNRIPHDLQTKKSHIDTHCKDATLTVTSDFARSVTQPDISTLWNALALTNASIIDDYMRLDAEILAYKGMAIDRAHWHSSTISVLLIQVFNLTDRVNADTGDINARLIELTNDAPCPQRSPRWRSLYYHRSRVDKCRRRIQRPCRAHRTPVPASHESRHAQTARG
jgi:hypothetical protein